MIQKLNLLGIILEIRKNSSNLMGEIKVNCMRNILLLVSKRVKVVSLSKVLISIVIWDILSHQGISCQQSELKTKDAYIY